MREFLAAETAREKSAKQIKELERVLEQTESFGE
jgi:hypothetical protein